MKQTIKTFFALVVFTLLGCDNDTPNAISTLEGTYTGNFTVVYENGSEYSNPVIVTFESGSYTSSDGENRVPAGGSGTYEIEEGIISFTDDSFWTAEFDWNLVLHGEYNISHTKAEIRLTANKNDVGTYTYVLNKQ